MLKKLIIVFSFFCASVLSGCDSSKENMSNFKLKCGAYDVFIETLDADTLQTAINGEKITVNLASSLTSVNAIRRYEGKGAVVAISILNKEDKWFINIDNSGQIACTTIKK